MKKIKIRLKQRQKKLLNEFNESWNQTSNNRGQQKNISWSFRNIFLDPIGSPQIRILGYNKEGFIQILLSFINLWYCRNNRLY